MPFTSPNHGSLKQTRSILTIKIPLLVQRNIIIPAIPPILIKLAAPSTLVLYDTLGIPRNSRSVRRIVHEVSRDFRKPNALPLLFAHPNGPSENTSGGGIQCRSAVMRFLNVREYEFERFGNDGMARFASDEGILDAFVREVIVGGEHVVRCEYVGGFVYFGEDVRSKAYLFPVGVPSSLRVRN